MRYTQIKDGQKLHLVYEAGEGRDAQNLIKANHVSAPICGMKVRPEGEYYMANAFIGLVRHT